MKSVVVRLKRCPATDCTLTASVRSWGNINSTDGPVLLLRTDCAAGHWFLAPTTSLYPPGQE